MPVGAGTEQSLVTDKHNISQDNDDCNPFAGVKLRVAENDKRMNGIHPNKGNVTDLTLNDLYSLSFKKSLR